jgi:hypothetical protein
MGKYAFIDRIFGTDDEEETGANEAFDEDDDDLDDDDSDDEDDTSAEEDDATLAQLDKDFRRLRARVRGSSDLSELRSIRADQSAALAGPQTPTFRLRTRDIIEEIDARVTDVRASRGPRGS